MANMRCAFCFPIPSSLKSYTANLQHKKKTAPLLHASISDTEYKKKTPAFLHSQANRSLICCKKQQAAKRNPFSNTVTFASLPYPACFGFHDLHLICTLILIFHKANKLLLLRHIQRFCDNQLFSIHILIQYA